MVRRGRWLALPCGALLAAAFAPTSVQALAILCPALLFALWQGAEPREAAWRGFLFTAGTFLAGTYWLYHSIHLVGQAPIWIAAFLMLGLVAIMGAYTALIGYAAARWFPAGGWLRWMVGLPAAWVLAEWVRGWFLSGFPWLALGYSQLQSPLRGYAPVLGVYGVSLAAAVTAGALLAMLLDARRPARLAVLAVVGAVWLAGLLLLRVEWTQPRDATVPVALVQGAVPQSLKWRPGEREQTMQLYLGLTRPYFSTARIVVWPESAIPALAEDIRPFLEQVRAEARAGGASIVMGLIRREPTTGAYYNALAAWSPAEQWYYKRRLVPFGEFFPVPDSVREWMRLMNLPYSDFQSGSDDQSPLVAAGEPMAPTICYEDAYGSEQRRLESESTLLVNVSNDAWFGDSTAPHQHLDISRMRALEADRPMLRATNDGVTALIAHDGSVIAELPQFKPAVLTGVVQPRVGLTPYLRAGNGPVLVLIALALAAAVFGGRRERAASRGGA